MNINKEAESEIIKQKLKKTQKDWIDYFNSKGEKMISAPDIYRVAKEENKNMIDSLKKDFKEKWIVTSTRIIYNKDNLEGEIIHDVDSKLVIPKKYKIIIPIIQDEAKQDKETEAYLRALFDTKDTIDLILKVLKRFDKDRKIYLWTPSQSSRADKQVRSVGLGFCDFVRFGVVGDGWVGDSLGLSRGVIIYSAKQTKKSRGNQK